MAKVRVKKRNVIIAVGIVVVIIVLIAGIFRWKQQLDYQKTYEYKLENHGYSKEDTAYLIEKLSDKELDAILARDVDQNILKFMKEQYYLKKHLDEYLAYQKEHPEEELSNIVAIINVNADREWYSEYEEVDVSKDILLLSNKFHKLPDNYEPEDLENVKNWYAYGDNPQLRKEAYSQFVSMYNAAKEDGQDLIINSAYRSYKYQDDLYAKYLEWYGQKETDAMAARPGFSEHQTGLSMDIMTYGANSTTFEATEEFAWLQKHAHEYGFILRYPKGKEYLTGYEYESWHYRYVGEEVATYIYQHDITFDEYYAYFIEGE